MKLLFNKYTLNKLPYSIDEINDPKYTKLNVGEWMLPVCDDVNKLLQTCYDRDNCCFYNTRDNSYFSLLENIKKYNTIESLDNILLTNGSDNALRLICSVFLTPDTNVLLPIPTYPHFRQMLSVYPSNKIDTVEIDYKMLNTTIEQLLEDKLDNNYHLTYIVRPNMPLGYSLSFDYIEKIIKKYENTLFVIDEAYLEFSNIQTVSPLIDKYDNIIVVKTFSKFFSLASLRIGYLMTNNTVINLIRPHHNLKDLTKIAISAANKSLLNLDHYMVNRNEYFRIKHFLQYELYQLLIGQYILDYTIRDNMFFLIFVKNPSHLCEYMKNNFNIIVRDKSNEIPQCIRISIGPLPLMRQIISVIKSYPDGSSN